MNIETFKQLDLSNNVLKSIQDLGFTKPSKIQEKIIPFILEGYDVVGQAQTGTGKTLAFASSILSKINVHDNTVKAIVLAPTRELALQICEEFETLNKEKDFNLLAVFGGSNIELQIRTLKRGVDIVVGTPGRIMDLMKRNVLHTDHLSFFVLDEADEMLNMGFEEDIKAIFEKTNKQKQVLLFSATMPKSILRLASNYMNQNYKYVAVEEKSETAINVIQTYYIASDKMKVEALCRVLDNKSPKLAIIFCQKKSDVDKLLVELTKRNYSAEAMHGDIAQNARIKTLERFKNGMFTYLIATDVAARGIHVNNIDLVINYNLPQDVESYVHRVGRTGRAGKHGEAISFVTPKEIKFLEEVKRIAKCDILECALPNSKDIIEAKSQKILSMIQEEIENKKYEASIPYVRDLNKEDLLKFSASLFQIMLEKEIGADFTQEIKSEKKEKKRQSKNTIRVFLTVGKMDNIQKIDLLNFLTKTTNIDKRHFNRIEILDKFTFLDVDKDFYTILEKKIHNQKLNQRTIKVEKAKIK